MVITVKVTRNHINKGVPMDTRACPVYLSIVPFIIKGQDFDVGPFGLVFYDPKTSTVKLPKIVDKFMSDFDMHKEVKPFSFKVNIPKKFLKEKYHVSIT